MNSKTVKRGVVLGLAAAMIGLAVPAQAAPAKPAGVSVASETSSLGNLNSTIKMAGQQTDEAVAISIQGGKTKFKKHWWGYAVYLSSQDATAVAGGGAIAAAVLSRAGLPGAVISIILGIGTGALAICTGDNGAYIHAAWVGPSWCKRQ